MADFRASVIITEPVDVVFAYFANMSYAPEYMSNVEETEKLTDGPVGVGTKYRELRKVRGKNATAEIEYLAYEKNVAIKRRSNSNGLLVDYDYRFAEIQEGTQVEFEGKVHVKGLMMRLTKRVLVNIIKTEDGDHVQRAKELLESEESSLEINREY
ncbi:SRPBCC family protein [Niallia taxi]|uniref:SRPBCC family protein n=1 Tax=Niallia taxi TaxID=2499688 RepID=UPI00119CBBEA|nr:SRPBCC family protein [Niallia taxi]MCT2344290.1 SRPBCC family protein [Niallia taxi]MDE5053730.1 SRPBCC family protein [Niallia taxi]MED3964242.1 SRPBCC family protein [Niallia taxi]MED4038913.1 SRPBCC family protein [Niallia taxi]WOD63375.1 SRPBCC family protein [Niallia taxi]